ncbi:MAG: hypothetical protein ACE5Q3_11325 [Alphaproteobacteria bacterium]
MFTSRKKVAGFLILPFLATACVNSSSSTYSATDVGQVIQTEPGTVVSARIVDVKGGDNTGAGALAGAAVGGTAGYAATGGGSGGSLVTVLGALVGAGIGYLGEQQARSREGIEYVVRMDDGRVVTLVQNREKEEEPLPAGAPILVQYGTSYTRVIEQPSGANQTPPSDWKNPDEQRLLEPPVEDIPQGPGS